MKIAIHHTRYSKIGGSEGYIASLLDLLLEKGHEVHYFAAKWEEIEHPNLHFHRIRYFKAIPALKVLSFDRASQKILNPDEFDLVHGFTKASYQDLYTDGSGCFSDYEDFARQVRWNWWFRSLTLYGWAVRKVEKRRFQRGNFIKILTMSQFVKDQIQRRYGLNDDEVEVLYNGIDTERFKPDSNKRLEVRKSLNESPETQVALFIGNDYLRKGLSTLLKAMSKAQSMWNLWVVGKDKKEQQYKALAQDLGVASRVKFLGPQKQVQDYLSACDAFIFPSLYDVFGNVGFEAMATGIPSVFSAKAGVSEIIQDNKDGLFLENPQDVDLLASKLEVLSNIEFRAKLAKQARETAKSYSWPNHFERLFQIYEEVAEKKKRLRSE